MARPGPLKYALEQGVGEGDTAKEFGCLLLEGCEYVTAEVEKD